MKPDRLLFIDNLRVFCIVIVVFIHAAVTYSGVGSWYYNEPTEMPIIEKLFFYLFQSHAQAFSMSLFFFIAGYFIPAALERKGKKQFITDRLFRLGIPTLIYIFIIHPLCVTMAYPQVHYFNYIKDGIVHFEFLSWTGPMWFAFTLLLFSILYALLHPYIKACKHEINISAPKIVSLIGIITLLAFTIRVFAPIGTSFMNLQFCFFGAYIIIFYVGTLAGKQNILQTISLAKAKRWLTVAFAIGIPLWFIAGYIGKIAEGKMLIVGGLNTAAFLYALWESFFCVAFIVALLGITYSKWNTQNKLFQFLSHNTFGVYVFHAPILIALSVATKNIHIDALLKFALIGTMAVVVSYLATSVIRKIPVVGKLFN